MNSQRYRDVAAFVVSQARKLGATECELRLEAEKSVTTGVRLGKVENIHGAALALQVQFRAFVGKNSAVMVSSDIRRASLTQLIKDTLALARGSEPDDCAGLSDAVHYEHPNAAEGLLDEGLSALTIKERIALAMAAEAAAMAVDARITNSEGAEFASDRTLRVYANSLGVLTSYESSSCSLSCSVVATEGDSMQNGSWYSSSRSLLGLDSPKQVGEEAARAALQGLGGVKVKSQEVPVVFDQSMASRLISQFATAAHGVNLYRKTSFLAGKLGQMVASPNVTIMDDPHMPGTVGSRPFDDEEGLRTQSRVLIGSGRLESYFIGGYSARKLGMRPNGGNRATNLYLQAGTQTPAQIIASVKSGLYLTSVSGPGFNMVTGDYSMGASGVWIEDGKLAYPVEEITVAGNMLEMFANIEAVGNDLKFRFQVNAPTVKIARMMVAGE